MSCGRPDIRKATCLVIERNGMYLSRIEMLTRRVVWDPHLGSAWRTRNKAKAYAVADEYMGNVCLFNPIVWEVRKL